MSRTKSLDELNLELGLEKFVALKKFWCGSLAEAQRDCESDEARAVARDEFESRNPEARAYLPNSPKP